MALRTWIDIHVEDGQHQKATLSLRVKDIALAAAQTLPSAAKIEAIINAVFADSGTPSTAICVSYAVRVEEDAPGALGGEGTSAISSAIKTRNSNITLPGNWLLSIPGMNKGDLTWDLTNRNSISTTGSMWDAVRAAMADAAIAVGDPIPPTYEATPEAELFYSASGFDGRRAAPRPR